MPVIAHSHYRHHHPRVRAFGETSLSFDHLKFVDDLVSHWRTVSYLVCPTEVFNMLKVFSSDFGTVRIHSQFCACAYEFLTTGT